MSIGVLEDGDDICMRPDGAATPSGAAGAAFASVALGGFACCANGWPESEGRSDWML